MQNQPPHQHHYLNDFHCKSSEASQKAVQQMMKQPFTVKQFIEQAKKVASPCLIRRER